MARPEPRIITEIETSTGLLQVAAGGGIFVVTYEGQPIYMINNTATGPKYPRTAYVLEGQAITNARRLNVQFKIDKFDVTGVVNEGNNNND